MEEGEIVLITFPQDSEKKSRPALVLRKFPKYDDLLFCGISSREHQLIDELGIMIDETHKDFKMSGLKYPGVIRLNMLTMLNEAYVEGVMGKVSFETKDMLLQKLADYLVSKIQ